MGRLKIREALASPGICVIETGPAGERFSAKWRTTRRVDLPPRRATIP
jgi:hypothetical protein